MKAREAKAKGNIEWKDMHAKLKEVYGQMDEWERKKKARAHRVNRPEGGRRNPEDTVTRQETGTSVQGMMVGEATTSKGSSQEEAPTVKEGLGRTAFVGGIAPGTSSGTLQRHLQQFAQVKYCALPSGGNFQRQGKSSQGYIHDSGREDQGNGC